MSSDAVLMIGWEYPPHNSGGLGVACQGLTQSLAGFGQQIYFTLPYAHSGDVAHMKLMGCYDEDWFDGSSNKPPFGVYGASLPVLPTTDLDAHDLRSLPQSELEYRVSQYADKVNSSAKKVASDVGVVHAHDWMSFPAAEKIKRTQGKSVIAHVHSTEHDRIPNGHGSKFIIDTEKMGMEIADRVVAVSEYTKRIIVDKYNISPNKIDVVYNGIRPLGQRVTRPKFAGKRPVIVFMGRLTMQKGVEYFLYLASKVLKEIPDALFVVAGSGDQYHSLMLQNASMNLSANLLFTGFVRGKKRDMLLDRADVFVMPSLSEPFGLVALEAAQRNTPVIVSKNSGVSEVMQSAKVLDFWDVDKMTKEILQLIKSKEYLASTISGQNQDLSQLTWDSAAKKMQQVYMKVFRG